MGFSRSLAHKKVHQGLGGVHGNCSCVVRIDQCDTAQSDVQLGRQARGNFAECRTRSPLLLDTHTQTHTHLDIQLLESDNQYLFQFIILLHLYILCVYRCCISMCVCVKALIILLDLINVIYTEWMFDTFGTSFIGVVVVFGTSCESVCVLERESMFVLCKYQQANSGLLPLFCLLK